MFKPIEELAQEITTIESENATAELTKLIQHVVQEIDRINTASPCDALFVLGPEMFSIVYPKLAHSSILLGLVTASNWAIMKARDEVSKKERNPQ